MRATPFVGVLLVGALLLHLVPVAQATASAYQDVCVVRGGDVSPPPTPRVRDGEVEMPLVASSAVSAPAEDCAQVVVVADVASCTHAAFGDLRCTIDYTATMSVSGVAACGSLSGVVSMSGVCPTLLAGSATGSGSKDYDVPARGGGISEPFTVCVSITNVVPGSLGLGGATSKCATFELTAYIAPNAEISESDCSNPLACIPGIGLGVATPVVSYAGDEATSDASLALGIATGALP